jgi:hypothetical protein
MDKSAMAKNSINLGQDTSILAMKCRCMEHIIREAIQIELHPDNLNREGFSLSKS